MAGWQSGYAAACKAVYAGSIPASASMVYNKILFSEKHMDQENFNNDEINVIELFEVLQRNLVFLGSITFIFAFCSVFYSFTQHEIWRSSTILEVSSKIAGGGSSSGGGLSLAGIKLKDDKSDSSKALTLMTSRDLFKQILENNEEVLPYLMAFDSYDKNNNRDKFDPTSYDIDEKKWIFGPPSFNSAYLSYLGTIDVDLNIGNGFIYLSASHRSPIFAKNILNIVIDELNNLARQRDLDEATKSLDYLYQKLDETFQDNVKLSISALIESQLKKQTLAKVKDNYLVDPLDSPFIPEERYSPVRRTILLYGTIIGLMLGVIFVLLRHYVSKHKNS